MLRRKVLQRSASLLNEGIIEISPSNVNLIHDRHVAARAYVHTYELSTHENSFTTGNYSIFASGEAHGELDYFFGARGKAR